jgi:hypothetical protein
MGSDDGWWNAEKMVKQTEEAIATFNKAFPGDIAVFAFDNSSGHTLVVSWFQPPHPKYVYDMT